MARTRRTPKEQINRPYAVKAELQNNGTFYGYDRQKKEQILEIPKQAFFYIDHTYFRYLLKIQRKKRITDLITTEYNRTSQTVTAVDRLNDTREKCTPAEVADLWGDSNTGIAIYAIGAEDNRLYRFEGASSVLGRFKDFEKECKDLPDFTLSTHENETGEGPKNFWLFTFADIEPTPEQTLNLDNQTAALAEYYREKGLYFDHLTPANQDEEE